MNNFCKYECVDKRTEECALPGRVEMLIRRLDNAAGILSRDFPQGAIALEGQVELGIPEVITCVAQHKQAAEVVGEA